MAKVVIPVTMDTKQAQKELEKLKSQEERLDQKKIKLDLDEEQIRLDLQKIDNDIEALQEKMSRKRETSINLGTDSQYQGMVRQMDLLNQKGDLYLNKLSSVQLEADKTTQEYEKQKQKQQELGQIIENNKNKQQDMNTKQREHSFHLGDIIKKVTRWGLAMLGIHTAYSGVRRIMSLVAGSNDQVAQKMEQMRNVVVSAFVPFVEKIVNLLMKVMVYINYITKALFGKAIFDFSKATDNTKKNMASTAKSAGSTAKALKQASKQLAGFDEMNVLSDNRSSGGGGTSGVGGVGGLDTNMFDKLGEIKIPDWLKNLTQWIKDAIEWFKKLDPIFKELLVAAGLLIGTYVLGGKGTGLLGIAGVLKGLATIGVIALGVDIVYKAITGRDLVEDLTEIYNAYKELKKINEDNAKQEVINTDNSIKSFDKKKKAILTLSKNSKAHEMAMYTLGISEERYQQGVYQTIRNLQDKIIVLKNLKNPTNEQKRELRNLTDIYGDLYREGVLTNEQQKFYKALTDQTIKSEKDRTDVLGNLIYQQNQEYIASQNEADGLDQVKTAFYNGKQWMDKYGVTLDTITEKSGLSKDQTLKVKKALDEFEKSDGSYDAIKRFAKQIETIGGKAGLSKDEIKKLWENISKMKNKKVDVSVQLTIDNIKEKVKGSVTRWFNAMFGAKGMVIGYSKGGVIPYAKGGIINRPSKGVPLPIGGEHGMEGVVPLTDSQQMALLGEAIGKYITINANITNTMNGRVLSRELQKIQNEESFASNRW